MKAPVIQMQVNEAVVCAELDDEAVLLNAETGLYFGLDAIGAQIWKLLEQRASEEEIVARLLDEYEVGAGQLRHDVTHFVKLLESKGLVNILED